MICARQIYHCKYLDNINTSKCDICESGLMYSKSQTKCRASIDNCYYLNDANTLLCDKCYAGFLLSTNCSTCKIDYIWKN
jgi:hypothetical protein